MVCESTKNVQGKIFTVKMSRIKIFRVKFIQNRKKKNLKDYQNEIKKGHSVL